MVRVSCLSSMSLYDRFLFIAPSNSSAFRFPFCFGAGRADETKIECADETEPDVVGRTESNGAAAADREGAERSEPEEEDKAKPEDGEKAEISKLDCPETALMVTRCVRRYSTSFSFARRTISTHLGSVHMAICNLIASMDRVGGSRSTVRERTFDVFLCRPEASEYVLSAVSSPFCWTTPWSA